MPDYTPFQKGVIKRYYEHRDTIALQKLAETVSNLYVETNETKMKRAWTLARKHMLAAGVHEHYADTIVGERDLGELAKVVSELS